MTLSPVMLLACGLAGLALLGGCAQMSQTDAGALCLREQGLTLNQYFYQVRDGRLFFVARNGGTAGNAAALNACLDARMGAMARGESAYATPASGAMSVAPATESAGCPPGVRGMYRGTLMCNG